MLDKKDFLIDCTRVFNLLSASLGFELNIELSELYRVVSKCHPCLEFCKSSCRFLTVQHMN